MVKHNGQCHCGVVKWTYPGDPEYLTACNCSICSRLGCLWAYQEIQNIALSYSDNDVVKYIWGDQALIFISCKHCGCTTHWERVAATPEGRMGVNFRMLPFSIVEKFPVKLLDGADTWEFLD